MNFVRRPLVQGLSIAIFVVICAMLIGIYWRTNDDVGMMQVAHGFGISAFPSPEIVFSNVLWGKFSQVLPTFGNIHGYSIAMLLALVTAFTALFSVFRAHGVSVLLSSIVLIGVFVPSIFKPQFTITAAMLSIAACSFLISQKFNAENRVVSTKVFLSAILIFIAFLIRRESVFLVLVILAPLFPWKVLIREKSSWVTLVVLSAAIGFVSWINYQHYITDEWSLFNQTQPHRARLNDYGGVVRLMKKPELMSAYGYSKNDIYMISNWYLFDLNILNPERLKLLTSELGLPVIANFSWTLVYKGWAFIAQNPILQPFLIGAFLISAIALRLRMLAVLLMFLIVAATISFMGRPILFRIHFSAVVALFLAAYLNAYSVLYTSQMRRMACNVIVAIVSILIATTVIFEVRKDVEKYRDIARIYAGADLKDGLVVQGASLPYEALFPLVDFRNSSLDISIRSLGALTLAPYSNSKGTQKERSSIIDDFLLDKIDFLFRNKSALQILEAYCNEHYSGQFEILEQRKIASSQLATVRCNETLAE